MKNSSILNDLNLNSSEIISFIEKRKYDENVVSGTPEDLDTLSDKLRLLKNISWIDLQTHTLLIEFSTINPSAKLFSYNTISFDFYPSGYILKEMRFRPMAIFQDEFENPLVLSFKIILFLFILYFSIKEIMTLRTKGKIYFKSFEIYLEWFLIIAFFVGLIFYLLRIREREIIRELSGSSGFNLAYLYSLDESIKLTFAFCVSLSYLKIFGLLSFIKEYYILSMVLKKNHLTIFGFFIIFLASYLIFVQYIYLTFFDVSDHFSTFIKAMQTCFAIFLGKFDFDKYFPQKLVLAHLTFVAYNSLVVLVLLNLFQIILNQSMIDVKRQNFKTKIDLIKNCIDLLKEKLSSKKIDIDNYDLRKRNNCDSSNAKFKNFESVADSLLEMILEVS